MKNKKFFSYFGQGIAFVAFVVTAIMLHSRWTHPDMTNIRWFIEYWYFWVIWISGVLFGLFLDAKGKDNPV